MLAAIRSIIRRSVEITSGLITSICHQVRLRWLLEIFSLSRLLTPTRVRSSGQNAQGEREERRTSYSQNSITAIGVRWQTTTIRDDQQTSSDLSRTVFLTWRDKYNILQFSLFYSISVRLPATSATASAHCCFVYVCIKRIDARASLFLALVRVNQILCLNWSLTNCVSISIGDENDDRLQCAVNLAAIDRSISACQPSTNNIVIVHCQSAVM